MIELICMLALFTTIFVMCLLVFQIRSTPKNIGGRTLFVIAVTTIIFSLCFKPDSFIRWDLIEHFKLVDNMRTGGLYYATMESPYADLYVYNSFAYLISLLPIECQNLLTTIPLVIDFAIVGYIYKDMFEKRMPEATGKVRILAVLMWVCTFGLKLAISGIRCSLAVSIAALAIYLEMIQKKKKALSIFLYVVAIFIHNFAVAIIFTRLLAMLKKPILIILISLGASSILGPLATYVVENTDNEYLVFSFKRILETVGDMSVATLISELDTVSKLIYVCSVAFAIFVFIISINAKKEYKEDGYQKAVVNFVVTVSAVAVGLSFNYLYLQRFMYLMSFAVLMIIPLRCKKVIKIENIVLVPVAMFVFFFNDVYLFMVNYIGSYFLAS